MRNDRKAMVRAHVYWHLLLIFYTYCKTSTGYPSTFYVSCNKQEKKRKKPSSNKKSCAPKSIDATAGRFSGGVTKNLVQVQLSEMQNQKHTYTLFWGSSSTRVQQLSIWIMYLICKTGWHSTSKFTFILSLLSN